jgi:hypothetical protein
VDGFLADCLGLFCGRLTRWVCWLAASVVLLAVWLAFFSDWLANLAAWKMAGFPGRLLGRLPGSEDGLAVRLTGSLRLPAGWATWLAGLAGVADWNGYLDCWLTG